MSRDLVEGGTGHPSLPEGWKAPNGFNEMEPPEKFKMMWVGEAAATAEDIKAIQALGYRIDLLTLRGV